MTVGNLDESYVLGLDSKRVNERESPVIADGTLSIFFIQRLFSSATHILYISSHLNEVTKLLNSVRTSY